jgi:hypothetical protein
MPPATNERPPDVASDQPGDDLRNELQDLISAGRDLAFSVLQDKALTSLRETVRGLTERLSDYVEEGGSPGLMAAVSGAQKLAEGKSPARALLSAGGTGLREKVGNLFGGGGKGGGRGGKKLKLTNIVESIDVGVPVRVAYNQWTQFADFPKFMKKVENAENPSDEKVQWKAQVWWSHRTWESTILQQIPDEQIVWRSKGAKGYVDGAVTFHAVTPNMTRILLVMEYHPQGFFEQTGNLWRAQGRRARLEFKHFRRHVMTEVILHPDEVEGWRGVIKDGKVVKDHETALKEEQEEQQEREEGAPDEAGEGLPEDAQAAEPQAEADEEFPEAEEELPEDEYDEEPAGDEAADEADEEPAGDEAADEADEEPAGDAEEEELVGAAPERPRGRGRPRRPAPAPARTRRTR